MYGTDDAAGLAVEAVLGAVVADFTDGVADDLLDVDVRLRPHLAGNEYCAGYDERLDGASHVFDARWRPVNVLVSEFLQFELLRDDGVEDGV